MTPREPLTGSVSRRSRHPDGFSLLEVMLALAITLVVMALTAQTMRHLQVVFRAQSRQAAGNARALQTIDDIALELSRAGYGMGEGVPSVLGRIPGERAIGSVLTLRSNPDGKAGAIQSNLEAGAMTPVLPVAAFSPGTTALLVDARARHELVDVTAVSELGLAVRSRETADGALRQVFGPGSGGRVLGVREVRYRLRESPSGEGYELVKDIVGESSRVLARDVASAEFTFLDEDGSVIAKTKAEEGAVRTVRIALSTSSPDGSGRSESVATAVTLSPPSGTVDFEARDQHLRLTRVFYPVPNPTGVGSRPGLDWGIVIGAGSRPRRDPALAYSYRLEKQFMGAGVDSAFVLEDVRAPVAFAFAPEGSARAGSVFVAAWGTRIGHLSRIDPDRFGVLSAESEVSTFDGTEAMAAAGGLAFGADDALYVTSQEKGGIYRYLMEGGDTAGAPERLFDVSGAPGAMVEGTDGSLYFLMTAMSRSGLWRIRFDAELRPMDPEEVTPLSGVALSLARDPIDGGLFVLHELPLDDFIVTELSRGWLARASRDGIQELGEPPTRFSLRDWRSRAAGGSGQSRDASAQLGSLRAERLDFVAFDWRGSLYLGSADDDVIFELELPRPSGRYAVGLAATVVERGNGLPPEIRMHAWKKSALAF